VYALDHRTRRDRIMERITMSTDEKLAKEFDALIAKRGYTTEAQHQHHDLVVSAMRVHLDHDHCLESVILKGPTGAVRSFANRIEAERGVRHGQVNLVTVETGDAHHGLGAHHHRGHMHLIPRS
jgi:metal-responsive CopG/Arc/MetJ family transcriptional regulator